MFQQIPKHRANNASNDVHRPPLPVSATASSPLQLLQLNKKLPLPLWQVAILIWDNSEDTTVNLCKILDCEIIVGRSLEPHCSALVNIELGSLRLQSRIKKY